MKKISTVRTRFAPSPTGYIHIGNVRTALYAYLFAKHQGGSFILRMEDTDTDRYVPEAVELIYRTLRLVGLTYEEGPDVGGDCGPYVQSERKDIYARHSEMLLNSKGAYRCFCSKERLDALHSMQEAMKLPTKYDGQCKRMSEEELFQKLKEGAPCVVRQMIPSHTIISFHDEVFGDISVNSDELDETILIKSNGLPTYNFANVVDDHLMGISHVIRGVEYLSSTPKYILLYASFGWTPPIHVHLPPIMKSATKKFSKRDGDASFVDLLERGFLKEAIVNMIALLGWHPSDDRELYTLEELESCFSLKGLQKSPAIFDLQKLVWLNKEYLKRMDLDTFEKVADPYITHLPFPPHIETRKVLALIKDRIATLGEIAESTDFFIRLPDYEPDLFCHEKSKADAVTASTALHWTLQNLSSLDHFDQTNIKEFFERGKKETSLSTSQLLWAVRVALSGKKFTPGGAIEILEILGPVETERRLRFAQSTLEHSVQT